MEPQRHQQNGFVEARRGDGRLNMPAAELRTLAAEIGGSADTLLGAFEPERTHSESEQLLAPLDDILKDMCEIKTTIAPTTTTTTLSFPMVSNSSQVFLPNFTSPSRNLTYGGFISNEVAYEVPCSTYTTTYLPSAGQNFMPISSPVVQMPMPVTMHPHQLVNLSEEDNDGPIYLNFNIGNMPPTLQPIQRYQQQPAPAVNVGGIYPENNVRYMEFLNESGDTARARFFDNSAKGFREYRTYRQSTMNTINKIQFGQPNIEGCTKYIYATEVSPDSVVSTETPILVQKEANSFVVKQTLCETIEPGSGFHQERGTTENVKIQTITYSEEPTILICRPPLRTKRSVMEDSELQLELTEKEETEIEKFVGLEYIAVVDNSDIKIPTIRSPVGRTKRKQEFSLRNWEGEVSFEDPIPPKCDDDASPDDKSRSSPLYRSPGNKKNPLTEELFLGKRRRRLFTPPQSSNNRTTNESDYRPFCGDISLDHRKSRRTPTNRDSYRKRKLKRSKRLCRSFRESRADAIPSSDSDWEDLLALSTKSLKCPKCKKLFKTPRSLAIHQKRCSMAAEIENDLEITSIEYLESEKELDGPDEVSHVETSEVTTSVTVKEKTAENIVDKTDEIKEEHRENGPQDAIEENPLRRNTRSLTNLIASRKLGQGNDPKPENGQGKMKTATNKGTNANPRTRRKKGK